MDLREKKTNISQLLIELYPRSKTAWRRRIVSVSFPLTLVLQQAAMLYIVKSDVWSECKIRYKLDTRGESSLGRTAPCLIRQTRFPIVFRRSYYAFEEAAVHSKGAGFGTMRSGLDVDYHDIYKVMRK